MSITDYKLTIQNKHFYEKEFSGNWRRFFLKA